MQARGNYLSLFPRANSVELALCELPRVDELQFCTANLYFPSAFSLRIPGRSLRVEKLAASFRKLLDLVDPWEILTMQLISLWNRDDYKDDDGLWKDWNFRRLGVR